MTLIGAQLMEKEEGIVAEAKDARAFGEKLLPPARRVPGPLEARTALETESEQKKPLEMNCAQTGRHGGVIDTRACRCNETDAGSSAPVIY